MKKIKLTQGKEALVDDEDCEMLMEHKWCAQQKGNDNFYVVRNSPRDSNGKQKTIYMHRVITNVPKGKQVDHINGNTLDNRRENLRTCTRSQNQMNRGRTKNNKSGYKGIYYAKDKPRFKPWQAQIKHNKKTIYLGYYKTKEEAALAYNKKAIELFGEYAKLNNVL